NLIRDAMGFDQNRGDSLNVQVASFAENVEPLEEAPFWKRLDLIELAKDLVKYLVIIGVMLFVVFRVIKPALVTLFTPLSNTGGFTAAQMAQPLPEETYTPSTPAYEQSLLTARQIAQQEPKIVASVIKEWVGKNE
ncbi:MAG: flagellar basal body M-ring protein FliF, partial [Nitrosomonadales bacterium]|nr:flagellar basal body M-ring protein FliF [Nitrosomonadales bacterium]